MYRIPKRQAKHNKATRRYTNLTFQGNHLASPKHWKTGRRPTLHATFDNTDIAETLFQEFLGRHSRARPALAGKIDGFCVADAGLLHHLSGFQGFKRGQLRKGQAQFLKLGRRADIKDVDALFPIIQGFQ
jgi:hypothetical protein